MITEFLAVLRHLPDEPDWTVLLCPTAESARLHGQLLGVLLPGEAKFSGRTATLGNKRISVAAASDEVFLPPDRPFALGLLGWGATPVLEASEWQKQSSLLIQTDK